MVKQSFHDVELFYSKIKLNPAKCSYTNKRTSNVIPYDTRLYIMALETDSCQQINR